MVTAPEVGDAPIARKAVILYLPLAKVATCTQVKLFPLRVGVAGVALIAFRLETTTKTSRLAVGVIELVTQVPLVLEPVVK
jgi:hypothetical protein